MSKCKDFYDCDSCDRAWYDFETKTWVCPYALLEIPVLEAESIYSENED